jgi:hypothetical protein
MNRLPDSSCLHTAKDGDQFRSLYLGDRVVAKEWKNISLQPTQNARCMFRYPDLGLLGIPFSADLLKGFPGTLHLYQPVLLALEDGVHAGAQKLAGFVAELTRILQFDVWVDSDCQASFLSPVVVLPPPVGPTGREISR